MATIAYRDGIIAYDSRCTAGSVIVDDEYNKLRVSGGVKFVLCGDSAFYDDLITAYLNKAKFDAPEIGCRAIVVDGGLFEIQTDKGKLHIFELEHEKYYAMGSGEDHAITAMDLGCTAKEAVKMAAKRDTGTGGRIRTLKVS